jgi:hypothetical protein
MKATILFLFPVFACSLAGFSQGAFQNLDFESANVIASPSTPYPNFVSASSAIPDWTAVIGAVNEAQISYNSTTIGTANISVLGPTWSSVNPGIIDGTYSVVLQAGGDPQNAIIPVSVEIEQDGTIPANARSIVVDAWNPDGSLAVSFGGTSLAMLPLASGTTGSGQQFTEYAGDISAFAGQSGTLEFSSVFNQSFPSVVLDDISFSPNSVTVTPEPSPFVLTAIGGILFALYRRFAPK